MKALRVFLAGGLLGFGLATAPTTEATYPGRNGDLAFSAVGLGPPGQPSVLWRLNPRTDKMRQLTQPAPSCRWRDFWNDSDVQWSPEGRSLTYFHWDSCSGSASRVGVWIMAGDGSRGRRIALATRDAMPMFSPDGKRVAVLWLKFFGDPLDVETQSLKPVLSVFGTRDRAVLNETGLPRLLGLVDQGSDWGVSGRIALASYRPRTGQRIEAVRADGDSRRRLTSAVRDGPLRGPSVDAEPSWGPDGRRLVFVRTREVPLPSRPRDAARTSQVTRQMSNVWLARAGARPDSGRRLTRLRFAHNPAFSPDGCSIVFSTPGGIYTLPASGGPVRRVVALGHRMRWGLTWQALSRGRPPRKCT